jgi:tRNA (guanine37-N1)-methyltransferase
MMKIYVVTLFPEIIQAYLSKSIMKKAQERGAVEFHVIPLRDFGIGKYKQVDDTPYGGGPGMLLRPEPVFSAVDFVLQHALETPQKILLTPQGKRFTQFDAVRLSKLPALLFLCGHYEGFDERIRIGLADEEISIGDYVLTGGELPALVVIDAVVRLLPGVLPEASIQDESFSTDLALFEYPQYTRPAEFRGMKVPEVLLSGNHAAIEKWRREKAEERGYQRGMKVNLEGNKDK